VALISSLGLPLTVKRSPQHHLGSQGGLRSLALAAQIARGDPLARVLVVYGDCMSTLGSSLPSPVGAEDICSLATLSDGAAAAVVGGPDGPGCAQPLARFRAARSELLRGDGGAGPEMLRLRARYSAPLRGLALQMTSPPDWSHQSALLLRPFAEALLADVEAEQALQNSHFSAAAPLRLGHPHLLLALQPAAEPVLRAQSAALGAPWDGPALAASRAVLSSRGDPSGAGALMALGVLLEERQLARGGRGSAGLETVLALALGPGVTAEGLLLELA